MILSDSQERDAVASANDRALYAVLLEFSITIPAQEIGDWRATKRVCGDIPGVRESITILCTDGVVGWFVSQDGRLLHAHVSHFTGKVSPAYSLATKKVIKFTGTAKPGVRSSTPKSPLKPRLSSVDAALDLLKKMIA